METILRASDALTFMGLFFFLLLMGEQCLFGDFKSAQKKRNASSDVIL